VNEILPVALTALAGLGAGIVLVMVWDRLTRTWLATRTRPAWTELAGRREAELTARVEAAEKARAAYNRTANERDAQWREWLGWVAETQPSAKEALSRAPALPPLEPRHYPGLSGESLGSIPGLGRGAANALTAAGITTAGALAAAPAVEVGRALEAARVRYKEGAVAGWLALAAARAVIPTARSLVDAAAPPPADRIAPLPVVMAPEPADEVVTIVEDTAPTLVETPVETTEIVPDAAPAPETPETTVAEELPPAADAAAEIVETGSSPTLVADLTEPEPAGVASAARPAGRAANPTGQVRVDPWVGAAAWHGEQVEPDDLTAIVGIGPVIAKVLADEGITTFSVLAEHTPEELAKILDRAGPRFRVHDTSSWPAQAILAAAGAWDQLRQVQAMKR
jgi:predicted flap endonuclease-1-like 5' DNA nuclease